MTALCVCVCVCTGVHVTYTGVRMSPNVYPSRETIMYVQMRGSIQTHLPINTLCELEM